MARRSGARCWDFEKETRCFNCKREAIQRIEVRPDEIVITCMNCGVARHYTVQGVYLGQTFEEGVEKG